MTRFQPDGPKSLVHFASLPVAGPVADFMVARGARYSIAAPYPRSESFSSVAGVNAPAEDDVLIATVLVLDPTGAVAPGCRADIGTAVSTIATIASSGRRTESWSNPKTGNSGSVGP